MSLFHYFRKVFCFLLIYINVCVVVHANYNWQNFETLLDNGKYLIAIKQLDENLVKARSRRDEKEWTLILLRGARARTLNGSPRAAINYLLYSDWPENKVSHSILNLALAKEYEQYLNAVNGTFLSPSGSKRTKLSSTTLIELVQKVSHHYKLALDIANDNDISTSFSKAYLTQGNYPNTVRGGLSDIIGAYWQQFLMNENYWTSQQKNALNSLDLTQLLNFSSPNTKGLKHPLLKAKRLSQQSFLRHKRDVNPEAAFEVKRLYAQLLSRHFSGDENINLLSDYLFYQLAELGPEYPWWTMGQFQILSFKQKLLDPPSLIEIYDLAIEAVIIHTESLGSKKSQRLIDELEHSEFMITGVQSSKLNSPSIEIEYRNLQKLYFKAWRVMKPLPIQMKDDFKTSTISNYLLQEPDSQWVANLSDQFDLRKHTIHHRPQIARPGHWIILASPNKNFQESKSSLQLLSMQFSQFVASVNYANEEFKVAVYQQDNGLPEPNISVDLIKTVNGSEEVTLSTKTDRKGIAILKRLVDADFFRIRIHRGDDQSLIDIPSLLSLKDERSWSMHPAKALLLTDKDSYRRNDTIDWRMISRAATNGSGTTLTTNSNKKAWLRLFDDNNRVIFDKSFRTDDVGIATGKILLSTKLIPELFTEVSNRQPDNPRLYQMVSSWGGQKIIAITSQNIQADADTGTKASIKLEPFKVFEENTNVGVVGQIEGLSLSKTRQTLTWSLKRTSNYPSGDLFASSVIDWGEITPEDSGHFNFNTKLSLGDDKEHQLKHRFTLSLRYSEQSISPVTLEKDLFLNDKKAYYSLADPQSFFVEGEASALNLLKQDNRSNGLRGESRWYIYKLLPSTKLTSTDKQNAYSTKSWIIGSVIQNGVIVHDDNGNAKIPLNDIESGMHRLKVVPKNNSKQEAFEYDFIVAENKVSKNLDLSGVLLTDKSQLNENSNSLRLLAGSGIPKQWSRLTISRDNKQLTSQMLSPGIHLLTFPINGSHQGGISFSLEWVGGNHIDHRDLFVEVPWSDKQLSLAVSEVEASEASGWRLTVKDRRQKVPLDSGKAKVLLSFTEIVKDAVLPEKLDLQALYWESRSSVLRLNNNKKSYPHYYDNQSKHFPSHISDVVELPKLRYTPNNDDLLSDNTSEFTIDPVSVEDQTSKIIDVGAFYKTFDIGPDFTRENAIPSKLRSVQHDQLTHFLETNLDGSGGLNFDLPQKFKGKKVHLRAIVVTPDFKTGQLSIILR